MAHVSHAAGLPPWNRATEQHARALRAAASGERRMTEQHQMLVGIMPGNAWSNPRARSVSGPASGPASASLANTLANFDVGAPAANVDVRGWQGQQPFATVAERRQHRRVLRSALGPLGKSDNLPIAAGRAGISAAASRNKMQQQHQRPTKQQQPQQPQQPQQHSQDCSLRPAVAAAESMWLPERRRCSGFRPRSVPLLLTNEQTSAGNGRQGSPLRGLHSMRQVDGHRGALHSEFDNVASMLQVKCPRPSFPIDGAHGSG